MDTLEFKLKSMYMEHADHETLRAWHSEEEEVYSDQFCSTMQVAGAKVYITCRAEDASVPMCTTFY